METENTIEKTFTQGEGEDELKMTVHITPEEEKMMEQIKSHSPMDWEGRDLDLLMEARKVLKENKPTEEQQVNVDAPVQSINNAGTGKSHSYIIWIILGVIGLALTITSKVIKAKTDRMMSEIVSSVDDPSSLFSSNTNAEVSSKTLTIDYHGVSFDYPGNWTMKGEEMLEDVYCIEGESDDNVISVYFVNYTGMPIRSFIDNMIAELDKESLIHDLSYSSYYNFNYNKWEAVAVDFSYRALGTTCYGKMIGFEADGYTIVVNPIVDEKEVLESEDLKLMERTMKVKPS